MTRFAQDTAVAPVGDGRYTARIDRGWWIERGPNGGYLAAIVLRAILAEVANPERRPRSLTLHYLRPPVEGRCEVHVVVERAGRGMTTVSARLSQDGNDCVVGLAALGVDRPGPGLTDLAAPDVTPVSEETETSAEREITVPLRARYESLPRFGGEPFAGASEALTGGWIRTVDGDPVDEILVAALTDAWIPAVFTRLELPVGVPTIDLTIHFREAPAPAPTPTPASPWSLVRFRTSLAAEGYLEEDGEVWSADGRLLAQSRQLALLLAPG